MNKNIDLKDIVDHVIIQVLQTPWDMYGETESCRVFVRLNNDLLFELCYVEDEYSEFPIENIAVEEYPKLIDAEFLPNTPSCIGSIIVNVVTSEYWPTFGVALNNKTFLYARDWGTPFKFGAFVEPINKTSAKDVFIYGNGELWP